MDNPSDSQQGGAQLPPDDAAGAVQEVDDTQDTPLTLTADQVTAAGITSLKPGDAFSVTIKGTVTDNTDGGIVADIDDVQAAPDDGTQAPPKPAAKTNLGGKILSPQEAGFGDAGNMLGGGSGPA